MTTLTESLEHMVLETLYDDLTYLPYSERDSCISRAKALYGEDIFEYLGKIHKIDEEMTKLIEKFEKFEKLEKLGKQEDISIIQKRVEELKLMRDGVHMKISSAEKMCDDLKTHTESPIHMSIESLEDDLTWTPYSERYIYVSSVVASYEKDILKYLDKIRLIEEELTELKEKLEKQEDMSIIQERIEELELMRDGLHMTISFARKMCDVLKPMQELYSMKF